MTNCLAGRHLLLWLDLAMGLAVQSFAVNPHAQGRLAFEVVSIKESKTAGQGGSAGFRRGGTFVATNTTAATLLYIAYRTDPPLQSRQYAGTPDWAHVIRYDITAKVSSDVAQDTSLPVASQALYVRALLEDRFALHAHLEQRDLPVYALTAPNGAGKLRRSALDCTRPEDRPKCAVSFAAGVTSAHMELSNLIGILANATGRPVVDRTAIAGAFDIDLRYAVGPPPPDALDQPPSVFTAVEELLGLKLEATHAPVNILLVERMDKPTQN